MLTSPSLPGSVLPGRKVRNKLPSYFLQSNCRAFRPHRQLRASDELHFCNSSSREKELGGLTLWDDSWWSCCQITGTTSPCRSWDQARLPDSAIPEKKRHVYKTHMKRNELPITQKSLNKAPQTFHVQQTNDTRSLGNNITEREAVSGEGRKSIFQKYENGLAH